MVTILLERREFIRATHLTSADLFLILVVPRRWRSQPRTQGPLSSSVEQVPWFRLVTCLP